MPCLVAAFLVLCTPRLGGPGAPTAYARFLTVRGGVQTRKT